MLDLPRGTVNSRLRRALDALVARAGGRAMSASSSSARCARPSRPDVDARASARAAPSSPPTPRTARAGGVRRAVPLVWVALAAILAALVVTQRDSGPAQAVERLVRDIVRRAEARAQAGGRAAGERAAARQRPTACTSVERGAQAPHSAHGDATWSPRGLFVGVDRRAHAGRDQARRRRALAAPPGSDVGLPRWAPDGLHIAYRADRTLRIVYGNGEHDVLAGRAMAAVAPAWRPNEPRTVAWAAHRRHGHGRGRRHGQGTAAYRGGAVRHLAWSADGRRLLIAGRRHGTIHDFATGR